MSDSTSSGDKSSGKSSTSKPKDSGSGDASASTSKTKDGGSGDTSASKPAESGGDGGKSAKESVGGKSEVHYGFFSSVRTPAYRSGWDDIWGKEDAGRPGEKGAKARSKGNSKSKAGARPATVKLKIDHLPDDVRDGLVEAARRKMRKSRSSYDKLDASGVVDWTISVTVNGRRT